MPDRWSLWLPTFLFSLFLPPSFFQHNFAGVVAWLMGGLSHIARACLMWDVMRAHGHEIGGGTILLLLASMFVIIAYFFFAYRSSLSAKVAAITAALMSIFLSIALFHASSLNHVAPGAAIGAGVGLWLYALLGQNRTKRYQAITQNCNWIFVWIIHAILISFLCLVCQFIRWCVWLTFRSMCGRWSAWILCAGPGCCCATRRSITVSCRACTSD